MLKVGQDWVLNTVQGLGLEPGDNVALVDVDGTLLDGYALLGSPDKMFKAGFRALAGALDGGLLRQYGVSRAEDIYHNRVYKDALDMLFNHALINGKIVCLTASPQPFIDGMMEELVKLWSRDLVVELFQGEQEPEELSDRILANLHVIGSTLEGTSFQFIRGQAKEDIARAIQDIEGVNLLLGAGNYLPADRHIGHAANQLLVQGPDCWRDDALIRNFWTDFTHKDRGAA